jgi:peptide/nickel transport system substrate-binding protein
MGSTTNTTFIVFNLNNRKNKNGKYYVDKVKQSWFQDRNFRSAVDWAIDRDDLVLNIFSGFASPLYSAEALNSLFLNEKVAKGHKKDINHALDLLKKSGFYQKDGILYDKNGNRVEFDLYTNAGALERESIGVMIKQDLEDLGMKVNFKPIEFNSLVNKLSNTNDWDMAIMGLTGSPLEPHDGKNVWLSTGPLHLFNQRQQGTEYNESYLYPWEKELDEIFEEGALKLSFEERKPLYDRYQEIIYEEKPIIYLYSPIRITAIRRKFKNIFPSSLSGLIYNIDEIFVNGGEE